MTTLLQTVLQADNTVDLEAAFNAAFLTRLDSIIRNVQLSFNLSDSSRPGLILTVDYETGGMPMVNPWRFKAFTDQDSMVTVSALLSAYQATLPLAFFSQSFAVIRPSPSNSKATFIMGAVSNAVLAEGNTNWIPIGGRQSNLGNIWNVGFTNSSGSILGIAYGSGVYVIILPSTLGIVSVWTSPDGLTWTPRRDAPAAAWNCIAYGNGKFIAAAAAGVFMSSTDGITWTQYSDTGLSAQTTAPGAIMFANNTWVVVNSTTTGAAFSTDGITWTVGVHQATGGLQSITYGNGMFLAVGAAASLNIMTSTNGQTWTTRAGVGTALRGVAWSPALGLFAAVGVNFVTTSPDGVTWTTRTAAANQTWWGIVWDATNALFISAQQSSSTNQIMTSPDGITWTSRATDTTSTGFRYLATNAGVTVACLGAISTTVQNLIRSTNGTTWNTRSANGDLGWAGLTYGNGLYVAVSITGVDNGVMTSPDGLVWTQRVPAANNAWRSITYSPTLGLFVAVASTGTGNRVMTSPDGITWTIRVSAADNDWKAVVWGAAAGLFVAVSDTGTGNRVMTSPDGITWTIRVSAANNPWASIAYGNGIFVAVATSGTYALMTSPDGITWTSRFTASTAPILVIFGGGLFLIGSNNSMTGLTYYSTDGISWAATSATAGVVATSMGYGMGKWVIASSTVGNTYFSNNGKAWRTVPAGIFGQVLGGIAFGAAGLVAIGNSGGVSIRAWVSPP